MDVELAPRPRMNRLALAAMVAALVALPTALVMLVLILGQPFQWLSATSLGANLAFRVSYVASSLVSFLLDALTVVALVLGTAAVVQIRLGPERYKGRAVALWAIGIVLVWKLVFHAAFTIHAMRFVLGMGG